MVKLLFCAALPLLVSFAAAAGHAQTAPAPCPDRSATRNAYFGDLHVHTSLSFDASAFDATATPAQAYRFAQGDPLALAPLDESGAGTRTVQIDRPLDFAAVTDHSEYLGETELCTTPASPVYGSARCATLRGEPSAAVRLFGIQLSLARPARFNDVCGADGLGCVPAASAVWERVQEAAQGAYSRCSFTTFVGYEYTAAPGVSTLHRNVIFRGDQVTFPVSYFEEPKPQGLWAQLQEHCRGAGSGCDALAIPHNPNESNGKMFLVEYPGAVTLDDERAQAALRASMEPVVEIYQHKGDSECINGISGIVGAHDELCDFEKDPRELEDCFDDVGFFGTNRSGCQSRRDFLRGALLEGLAESERIGVNPFPLGVIASTDTHNGTPGAVSERSFAGHRGTDDASADTRLGDGMLLQGGVSFSPGGLVGVWAEENSREALFDALRRREVFGTSGPRITPRFFAGWSLPAGLCRSAAMLEKAYQHAVPMGSRLPLPPPGARRPRFLVSALMDPGTAQQPGTLLQRIQIVKAWRESGESHVRVYDVAGFPANSSVSEETCQRSGKGFRSLCVVWSDPDFQLMEHATYYARVVENPSCRWSTYECNALPEAERPETCSGEATPKTIQERAWTSPIWYTPGG